MYRYYSDETFTRHCRERSCFNLYGLLSSRVSFSRWGILPNPLVSRTAAVERTVCLGGKVDIGFTKKKKEESDRHGNPANENSIQSFSEPGSCRVAGRGTSVTKNVYTSMCPNTPNSSSSLRDLDRTSSSSSMRTSSLSRRLSPRVKLSGALLKLFRKGDSPSGA